MGNGDDLAEEEEEEEEEGHGMAHRRVDKDDEQLPTISVDYGSLPQQSHPHMNFPFLSSKIVGLSVCGHVQFHP